MRGLTGETPFIFSDLRPQEFLAFFAAIAVILCKLASQADSAIRRPDVS